MKKRKKGQHGGPRPGAGPKPLHGEIMGKLGLRVTDAQRRRWESAAELQGMSLSEWLRSVADAAADAAGV